MKRRSEAERLLIEDVREKKIVSRSYRNKRTHCGRGGAVRLPSDKLTKKELQQMNGQCETYRLNQPMKWPEFLAMPVEHQISYVKKLREKYGVPDARIARMMCIAQSSFSLYTRKLGIPAEKKPGGYTWNKDGWYLFTQGVAPNVEAAPAELVLSMDQAFEFVVDDCNDIAACKNVPSDEAISDDDAAFICEQTYSDIPTPADEFGNNTESQADECEKVVWARDCHPADEHMPAAAIPESGTLTFTGDARSIVNTLTALLGDTKVLLTVNWDVVD